MPNPSARTKKHPHSVRNNSPLSLLRPLARRDNLFIAAVALLILGAVFSVAWLCDDCFITSRYVANTLSGYGTVVNVGERVQGYTHPLWIVLLLLGSLIFPNPMFVAYGYSFLFTLLAVALVGRTILRVSPRFLTGAILLSVTGFV